VFHGNPRQCWIFSVLEHQNTWNTNFGLAQSPASPEIQGGVTKCARVLLGPWSTRLIRVGLKGEPPEPAPKLPALAREVAQEAAAFLEAHAANPQRSARALRRAWSQALILAAHDLEG